MRKLPWLLVVMLAIIVGGMVLQLQKLKEQVATSKFEIVRVKHDAAVSAKVAAKVAANATAALATGKADLLDRDAALATAQQATAKVRAALAATTGELTALKSQLAKAQTALPVQN